MTQDAPSRYFESNRINWDERARVHAVDATGAYNLEAFRSGETSLHEIELAEIGDVRGCRVAHLQCHIGLDTLSLARMGAEVTGLDFSPVAIAAARRLAIACEIPAQFVEGNVYDARSLIEGDFDLVYVTWGAINWLPDIARWAGVVASLLKPGGSLYLLEGHPAAQVLDEVEGRLVPRFDWRTPRDRPIAWDDAQSYTGDVLAEVARRCYEWLHPLGDIVNAVVGAGLVLTAVNEHETIAWKLYPMLVPAGPRSYRLPDRVPRFPLAFSLRAVKA
jgi:SAM-dependent methyltransferase